MPRSSNPRPRNKEKASIKLTLDIIKEGLGLKKGRKYTREYDDLDSLFGKWSDAEFREISEKISHERSIDPELWKGDSFS